MYGCSQDVIAQVYLYSFLQRSHRQSLDVKSPRVFAFKPIFHAIIMQSITYNNAVMQVNAPTKIKSDSIISI